MRGIDVSSHDGWPYQDSTEGCYRESDFVIAKATQGTGYVNPHFREAIDRAIGDGKLVGAYHYAGGGDPEAEARHFLGVSRTTSASRSPAWTGRRPRMRPGETVTGFAASRTPTTG